MTTKTSPSVTSKGASRTATRSRSSQQLPACRRRRASNPIPVSVCGHTFHVAAEQLPRSPIAPSRRTSGSHMVGRGCGGAQGSGATGAASSRVWSPGCGIRADAGPVRRPRSSGAAPPGSALGNRLRRPREPRAGAGGGPPRRYLWDVFIHMPAALPFPIGSRFYDWKYESEPEPHGRAPDAPRAREGPGRLQRHQRHASSSAAARWTTSAGAPTPAWTPGTTHLPAVLQAAWNAAWRPASRTSSAATPVPSSGARSCPQPAVRGVLRGGPAGWLPAHRGRERLPSRGFAPFDAQHPQRTPAVRGPRVPPSRS